MSSLKFVLRENIAGKTVFLRVDLNSRVKNGKLVYSTRLRNHARTMRQLSDKKCKLVVFSHQGRKGEKDFVSLKQHAKAISKLIGRKIKFVSWKDDYVKAVRNLREREILLLDNTRFMKEETMKGTPEEHATRGFVKKLLPLGDLFVQDAFSICHRAHASVVGFASLPCYIGPTLEREINALNKLREIKCNRLLVLGGAKPADSIKMLFNLIKENSVEKVLVGGLFGELFVKAEGVSFGAKDKLFEEKGFNELLPKIKRLYDENKYRVDLPVDFAVGNGKRKELEVEKLPTKKLTKDIGSKTIENFKEQIEKAHLIIFNGPLGVYEEKGFERGTKEVLKAISESKAFSILGGGDTDTALEKLGFTKEKFSHVSLAGKALLGYLSGEKLPGLEILGVD